MMKTKTDRVKVGQVYQDADLARQAAMGPGGQPTKTPDGPRFMEVVQVQTERGRLAVLVKNQTTGRLSFIRQERLLSRRYRRANRVTLVVHCDGDRADSVAAAIFHEDRLADVEQKGR